MSSSDDEGVAPASAANAVPKIEELDAKMKEIEALLAGVGGKTR